MLDFPSSTFYRTPCTAYADFTLLQNLPIPQLRSSATFSVEQDMLFANVSLENQGTSIAFSVHVRLLRANAVPSELFPPDVAPVFWSDNFITLMPGETRVLTARMATSDAGPTNPVLQVETFND